MNPVGANVQSGDSFTMLERWIDETPKDEPFHGLAPLNSKR